MCVCFKLFGPANDISVLIALTRCDDSDVLHIRSVQPESSLFAHKKQNTCVKRKLSKRPQIGFQDQLSLNTGQKYCRMLQGEHSAILSTFIKLPFVILIDLCFDNF